MGKTGRTDGQGGKRGPLELQVGTDAGPLHSIASFLILAGLAYRLMFSEMASSFLNNGIAALIFYMATVIYLVATIRRGAEPFRVNLASTAFILFTIACLLASDASGYMRAAAAGLVALCAYACLFVSVSGKLFSGKDAPHAAAFLVSLVAVAAAVALYQRFYEFGMMLRELESVQLPGWVAGNYISEKNIGDFRTRIESMEVFSTFFTSNVFAGFLALAVPVTAGLGIAVLKGTSKRAAKARVAILCGTLFVLECFLLLLTKSKAGLGAAIAATGILAVLLLRRLLSGKAFLATVAALLIVASAAGYFALPHARQFSDEAMTSMEVRRGYWRATWRMIEDDPYLGVGLGNFPNDYFAYKQIGEREVRNPHNGYLLIWAECGVFALLFFAAFWALVFAGRRSKDASKGSPVSGPFAAAAVIAAAVLFLVLQGDRAFEGYFPPAVPVVVGAVAAGALALAMWKAAGEADISIVRMGLAAGIAGFLLSMAADVTWSDAPAAAAAVFASAALAPRGSSTLLRPGRSATPTLAGLAALALILFTWLVFVPMSQAEMAMEVSSAALERGDLNASAEGARTAMELDPYSAEPPTRLGFIYETTARFDTKREQDFRLAEEFYKKAVELDCRYIRAQEGLARLYELRGVAYYESALEQYDILLKLYPTSIQYNTRAARLLEKAGLFASALHHYRKALEIDDHAEQHGIKLSAAERRAIQAAIARLGQ